MNKCRRLPGRVGIGSWSERGHGSTRSLFVAPCAGVLGRIPSVLSGKTPAWEQSGGKKAQGRGRILVGQHPSLRWSHWTSPGVRIFWFHSRQDCLLRVEMSWLHPNLSIQSLWGAAWESVYERLSQGNWDVWSCLRSAHVNCGRQWDKLTGSTVGRKCVCVFVRVLQQLWDEIRLLEFAKKQQGRHINQVPRMWP